MGEMTRNVTTSVPFPFLRIIQRDITINSCQSLTKLEFVDRFSKKYSNIKFHENLFIGTRVVPCGRKDRHDEANCSISQFCERDYKTRTHIPFHCVFFCLFVVFRFTTKFVIMLCKFNDVVSVVEDTGNFISDNTVTAYVGRIRQ
jgi:hypothetical protein